MSIKLVVFDMAGTTVEDDRYVHKALIGALKENKVVISEEDANDVMGIPKPTAIHQLLKKNFSGPGEITKLFIKTIHEKFVSKMLDFYENDDKVREKRGVTETFRSLKRKNIKIAIDTGFDRKIADAILNRLGWVKNDLIDVSITSDEVANGRPYPDMIFKAMEMTGVEHAEEVAKVGDTISDMQQGKNAGCGLVIGVTTGACKKEVLEAQGPTHLIGELMEILDILQSEDVLKNNIIN